MGVHPVKTYTAVIKDGWLSSFPGMTTKAVHKHLPKPVKSVIGYLHMIHKGICPIPGNKVVEINKLINSVMEPNYEEDILHKLLLNQKHKAGVSISKFDELNGIISTDCPGQFPITSARGNAYILVISC